MFAKSVSRRSVGKLHKTLLVALALVVLFASLPLERAYAWYIPNKTGTTSQPYYYPLDLLAGANYGAWWVWVNGRGPAFQTINQLLPYNNSFYTMKARYVLEQYTSTGWKVKSSQTPAPVPVTKGTGLSVQFDNVDLIIPWQSTGYFRVRYEIWWLDSAGRTIGYAIIAPNSASDFVCHPYQLRGKQCQSNAGNFWIR
jgi:hypothetical protein